MPLTLPHRPSAQGQAWDFSNLSPLKPSLAHHYFQILLPHRGNCWQSSRHSSSFGNLSVRMFWFLKRHNSLDDFDRNLHPDCVVGHSSGGGTLPQNILGMEVTQFEYGAPGLGEPQG